MTLLDDRSTESDLPDPTPTGTLRILDPTGDTTITWRVGNADEETVASETFRRLTTDKGYLAYRVDPADKSKGERMRYFDPSAGEMILSPQLVGG